MRVVRIVDEQLFFFQHHWVYIKDYVHDIQSFLTTEAPHRITSTPNRS